jgi:ribosome-associated toxin RatA of RatAB toxin-antitoxin module
MAEQASERIRIEAPPERCLAVVLDYEQYPAWAKDLKQVTILERDDEGRGREVEFRAAGLGQSFRYTLAYDNSALPDTLSWTLLDSDKLRRLDGTYRFEAEEGSTRVHYELTVEIAIPLPGLIKRRAAGMIMGTALKELKKAVESREKER